MDNFRLAAYANYNFTNATNITDDVPRPSFDLEDILNRFPKYRISRQIAEYSYLPITILGTIGNILTFIIMTKKSMARSSTCVYMASMSVVDTLVLYFGCLRKWFAYRDGHDSLFLSDVSCKIFNFLNYWCFDLAAWILVVMTIERFVAIRFPLKFVNWATACKAKKIIIFLVILFMFINIHILWTIKLDDSGNCIANEHYESFWSKVWPWIDATIYSFIPIFCLGLFNSLIIHANRKSLVIQSNLHASRQNSDRRRMMTRTNRRLTIMLLVVSAAFLLMSSPKVILMIIRPYVFDFLHSGMGIDFELMVNYALVTSVCNIFMYSNHAINFLLYCISGHRFRKELVRTLGLTRFSRFRNQVWSTIVNAHDPVDTGMRESKLQSSNQILNSNQEQIERRKSLNSSSENSFSIEACASQQISGDVIELEHYM